MSFDCTNGRCTIPSWMRRVLLAAGFYHLLFAAWAILWPHLWFDSIGVDRPDHPMLWRGVGLIIGMLGLCFLIAAKNPINHWMIVLVGFSKFTIAMLGFSIALLQHDIPLRASWLLAAELVWWPPFAVILWACLRAHAGVPPTRAEPLGIEEAANSYFLSNGKTLAQASESKLLALVFLRHFGCTFTRQTLRGLEGIQKEATAHGAELVLVHMLQNGKETEFLGERSGVARIAASSSCSGRTFGGAARSPFSKAAAWAISPATVSKCRVLSFSATERSSPRSGRILRLISRICPGFSKRCPRPRVVARYPHDLA